jgi:ribosomal protein L3
MANEFSLISTYVVDGSITSAGFTFSSIPQTYKNLQIIYTAICSGGQGIDLRWNGSASGYSRGRMVGTNASVGTLMAGTTQTEVPMMGNAGFTTLGCGSIEIANYATSGRYITVRSFGAVADTVTNGIELNGGTNTSTSNITSLTFKAAGGETLLTGSVFSLYGIG